MYKQLNVTEENHTTIVADHYDHKSQVISMWPDISPLLHRQVHIRPFQSDDLGSLVSSQIPVFPHLHLHLSW